jgi:hypothetical protein
MLTGKFARQEPASDGACSTGPAEPGSVIRHGDHVGDADIF